MDPLTHSHTVVSFTSHIHSHQSVTFNHAPSTKHLRPSTINQARRNALSSNATQALFKMLFRATLVSAVALLGINQAIGAPVEARGALTATTECMSYPNTWQADSILTIFLVDAACNCPQNCFHTQGSKCKYYSGLSDTTRTLKGSK